MYVLTGMRIASYLTKVHENKIFQNRFCEFFLIQS